jgi:hypothetical protein
LINQVLVVLQSYKIKQNLLFLLIFGIAMGFLEAVVVVYIREMYYPTGFHFPLVMASQKIIAAELVREICTIIMLCSVAFLVGKNKVQRLSYFLFSFAVWDIFYYIGLKIFLNWPASFLSWDVLFLIPLTWIGPVLAPIICSITMIIFSITFLYLQDIKSDFQLRRIDMELLMGGAILIFITFIWDFTKIIITNDLFPNIMHLMNNDRFREIITVYVPDYYNWPLFIIGILLIYFVISYHLQRLLFQSEKPKN